MACAALSPKEQIRTQGEGRQLIFRQMRDIITGKLLYYWDGGVGQAVERADENSRLASLHKLLNDNRRYTMVTRALRPQRLELPTLSSAHEAGSDPESDHAMSDAPLF